MIEAKRSLLDAFDVARGQAADPLVEAAIMKKGQTAKPPNRQTAKPPNRQTAKPPNRQTAKPPNRQTAKPPNRQTAKI